MNREEGLDLILRIEKNINGILIGKEDVVRLTLTGIIAGGHILIEDTPGTGKTLMAKLIAASIKGDFSRIQFTPDLLPADITGLNIYNRSKSEFEFVRGPVFTNILLADEINRATPRTQSALLESMEERQVTVDGRTYTLNEPFVVLATENPVETAGTFPLPEAQLDRFIMHLSMGSLSPADEVLMLNTIEEQGKADRVTAVCDLEDIVKIRELAHEVYIHDDLKEYLVAIVQKTRDNVKVHMGVSPRGTLWLMRAARAYAFIMGRDHVLPDDIKYLAPLVLSHRIMAYTGSDIATKRAIIGEVLSSVEVPSEDWSRR
ncbi:MAG: MoxR family ATPase [Lachnospiraceae bacterium]|nr:MoxR family ATPase [Lachnospiraceae bacterium]